MTIMRFDLIRCVSCGHKHVIDGFTSYSTFTQNKSVFYTDGFKTFKCGTAILRCQKCNVLFWRKDIEYSDEISFSEYSRYLETREIYAISSPSILQFPSLLDQNLWRTLAEEKYIRMIAWWAFNQPFRLDIRINNSLPESVFESFNFILGKLNNPKISMRNRYDLIRFWWAWSITDVEKETNLIKFVEAIKVGTPEKHMQRIIKKKQINKETFRFNRSLVFTKEMLENMPALPRKRTKYVSIFFKQLLSIFNSMPLNEIYEQLHELLYWNDNKTPINEKSPFTINLERLLSLLDDKDEEDKLMRAEILRELGRFEESNIQLNRITNQNYLKACNIIKSLSEKQLRCVAEFH